MTENSEGILLNLVSTPIKKKKVTTFFIFIKSYLNFV